MKVLLGAIVACVACAPVVAAHCVSDPADPPVTRLLGDIVDDCGADGAASNCHGTHDIHALDVYEAYVGGADSVLLRMTLDLGSGGALKDTISFTANNVAKSVSFTTDNDQTFQAQGCESSSSTKLGLTNPDGSPHSDGTRFALECRLRLSALGVTAGQSLAGFSIEATEDGAKGDIVPGGYYSVLGTSATPADSDHCAYVKPSYTLTGPTRYAGITAPAQVLGNAGEAKTANLILKNKLGARSQDVTLSVEAPVGVTVSMKAGDQSGSPLTVTLPALGERNIDLTVQSASAVTGTLQLVVTTNLGGRNVVVVPLTLNEAGTSGPNTTLPTNSQSGGGQSTPAPHLILALLGALALARRR